VSWVRKTHPRGSGGLDLTFELLVTDRVPHSCLEEELLVGQSNIETENVPFVGITKERTLFGKCIADWGSKARPSQKISAGAGDGTSAFK